METPKFKIGDVVRHKYIMTGINLSVFQVDGNKIQVRYAHQGVFQTQELFDYEVEGFMSDMDEYA
ncbi:MAG: hypothetical protein AAGB30_10715 [Pedobacter sp.]|nr:hypothetical protein [Pedobacter sp.]